MMNAKKGLLLLLCLSYSTIFFAQSKPSIHEVGITINSELNFGAFYKAGKENSLFRLKTLFLSGGQNFSNNTSSTHGAGLSLGAEMRKKIVDEMYFIYGFDGGLRVFGSSGTNNNNPQNPRTFSSLSISPQINFVLGLAYVFKEHWVFSFEVLPYLAYDISTYQQDQQDPSIETGLRYGLDLSSVQLGIAYRFKTKN